MCNKYVALSLSSISFSLQFYLKDIFKIRTEWRQRCDVINIAAMLVTSSKDFLSASNNLDLLFYFRTNDSVQARNTNIYIIHIFIV
jgi:hypothetical protein